MSCPLNHARNESGKFHRLLYKIGKSYKNGSEFTMEQKSKENLLYGDKRLGMFIHWGVYAMTEWHEQYLMRMKADKKEYEQLMYRFCPEHYDPGEWVRMAKDAGMDYICFTTKHHDGFCMWDTKQTDYNIMNTPYGKDVLKQLSEACSKYGVDLALYYSNPDWHHKNGYNPLSSHQIEPAPEDEPNMELYRQYVKEQVKELLTGYGRICGFFWDIPPHIYDPSINQLVRSLQPGIRINDRGYDEGDFSTPEREVPDGLFTKLTEACESVGKRSWGYRVNEDYYTARLLCGNIDTILTAGGNYLLNVGPMADGRIPKEAAAIVEKVGAWYQSVRESYKDTRYFMEFQNAQCKACVRDNVMYLHFSRGLDCTGIVLPPLKCLPESVEILGIAAEPKWAVELVPDVKNEAGEMEEYLHIYNLPAEETKGYPVVVKIVFAKGVLEDEKNNKSDSY